MSTTPKPWKLDVSTYPHDLMITLRDGENKLIAELSGFDNEQVKAHASLIVESINNYNRLRTRLRQVEAKAKELAGKTIAAAGFFYADGKPSCSEIKRYRAIPLCEKARELLQLVEGDNG